MTPKQARIHAFALTLGLVAGGFVAACAEEPKKPPQHPAELEPPPSAPPPAPEALPDEGPLLSLEGSPHTDQAIASLPGFRTFRDGRSRAFVEVSQHVPVSELVGTAKIIYHLRGVRVPDRVNRMDLPSTFFDTTPVARVRLVQVGDDADLVIDLRQPVKPEASVHQTPWGTRLVIGFPKLDPSQVDPHYRNQDEVTFGYDVLHKHTPYGEENRRLVHDHEGTLHPHDTSTLTAPDPYAGVRH